MNQEKLNEDAKAKEKLRPQPLAAWRCIKIQQTYWSPKIHQEIFDGSKNFDWPSNRRLRNYSSEGNSGWSTKHHLENPQRSTENKTIILDCTILI
jgi:hypothetical protein